MSLSNPKGKHINTLVESGTSKNQLLSKSVIISGDGTDLSDTNSLQKRAKRKTISNKMILSLIDVAKEKGDKERVKSYWNAYHCQSKIVSKDGRLYGKYCKNRFCTNCLAIRKADIINRYYPLLKEWEEPHFVTLTVKSIKHQYLKDYINGMNRAFKLIHQRCKKRHQRGKGIKLIGIKSLECNFNPKTKTYNPHFHLIVPNKETADLLKKEWLHQWKDNKKLYTSPKAQHIRKVENLERDLIETIKYGSKIFTEPDLKKKGDKSIPPKVYVRALDNIFSAMTNKRLFDRFGFNLPQQPKKETSSYLIQNFEEWIFDPSNNDWINKKSGEILSGYIQAPELEHLLENGINLNLY